MDSTTSETLAVSNGACDSQNSNSDMDMTIKDGIVTFVVVVIKL